MSTLVNRRFDVLLVVVSLMPLLVLGLTLEYQSLTLIYIALVTPVLPMLGCLLYVRRYLELNKHLKSALRVLAFTGIGLGLVILSRNLGDDYFVALGVAYWIVYQLLATANLSMVAVQWLNRTRSDRLSREP